MSEDLALLAAIEANEADDLPRLVYADWLDEHGEPELAALVRYQIQVYRTPNSDAVRRKNLRAQEGAAWKAYQKKWGPTVLGRYQVDKTYFHRGLIERAVTIPAAEFVARSWAPGFPVRRVHVPDPDGLSAAIPTAPLLGYLRGLLLGPPGDRTWREFESHPWRVFQSLDERQYCREQVLTDLLAQGGHRSLTELRAGFYRASRGLLEAILGAADLAARRTVWIVVVSPTPDAYRHDGYWTFTTAYGVPLEEQVRGRLAGWFPVSGPRPGEPTIPLRVLPP